MVAILAVLVGGEGEGEGCGKTTALGKFEYKII
jgi:hypothetical protein